MDKILAPSYGIKFECPQGTHTQQDPIIDITGIYEQKPPNKFLNLFVEVNGKIWHHTEITQFDEINKRWYGKVTAVENQPDEKEYSLSVQAVLVGKKFLTQLDNLRKIADAGRVSPPLDSIPDDVTVCDKILIKKVL